MVPSEHVKRRRARGRRRRRGRRSSPRLGARGVGRLCRRDLWAAVLEGSASCCGGRPCGDADCRRRAAGGGVVAPGGLRCRSGRRPVRRQRDSARLDDDDGGGRLDAGRRRRRNPVGRRRLPRAPAAAGGSSGTPTDPSSTTSAGLLRLTARDASATATAALTSCSSSGRLHGVHGSDRGRSGDGRRVAGGGPGRERPPRGRPASRTRERRAAAAMSTRCGWGVDASDDGRERR